jgi:hypothetical protein
LSTSKQRRKRLHVDRRRDAFGAIASTGNETAPEFHALEARLLLADTSFPVILQWFEGSYDTIESRAADLFAAGYG